MCKFKTGQTVVVRSKEVIMENTRKFFSAISFKEMVDSGNMQPFFKHCGRIVKIKDAKDAKNIYLEGVDNDCVWFEEDLMPFNGQLELEF